MRSGSPRPSARWAAAACAVLALSACSAIACSCKAGGTPVRLGLISGLSGGNADLGEAGRNGVMIAVSDFNRSGGIRGKPVELLVRDDGNDPEKARQAAAELIKERVSAIIGPFNATMVKAVLPVTEPARMLVVTPTASAFQFVGKDDWLFKLNSSTRENAIDYAEFMIERRKYRNVSVVVDSQNRVFTSSWLEQFKNAFGGRGGTISAEASYNARTTVGYEELAHSLLEPAPDAVLLITSSVDGARIAQQLRKKDASIPLLIAEWGGTQTLIEMGGKAVEGMEVLQVFNPYDEGKAWLAFADEYRSRFSGEPSFSSIMGYEAAILILQTLRTMDKGADLRRAVVRGNPFQGLQQTILVDQYGDGQRKVWFMRIEGRRFRIAP